MTGTTARSQDCINNNDNGGIIAMKTITLARTVLSMFNDGNKELTVEVKEDSSLELEICFGISLKTLFDGKYLVMGVYGGGFLRTLDWSDYLNCDADDETAVNDLTEKLSEFFNDWFGNRHYEILRCYYQD